MPNRYNDQDYPRYSDRNDRYDSQSERGSSNYRRGEQQGRRSGSGRERAQGGSSDYNRDEQTGYYGMSYDRTGTGSGQGFSGGNFGSDFGRGYSSEDRDSEDFTSATRPARGLTGGFGRNTGSDRDDYTLYGYDRESRYADRSGDQGDSQNQNYGYSGSSYARRDDDSRQSNQGRGGSSRYRGEQGRGFQGQQNFYGQGGDYTGSSEQGFDYDRDDRRYSRSRSEQDERGWWDKTSDEVASWFGDEEAARRRETDSRRDNYGQVSHRGKGPKNYRRSDERIKDDVNDRLTDYPYLDASDIDVEVSGGEVTLTGMVESRSAKRMAEDLAENVSGVSHVENRLRVKNQTQSRTDFAATNTTDTSGTYGSREDLAANYSNQLGTANAGANTTAGTSSLTDTNNATGGTNAGSSSGTTGSAIGSNPGTATGSTGTSDPGKSRGKSA